MDIYIFEPGQSNARPEYVALRMTNGMISLVAFCLAASPANGQSIAGSMTDAAGLGIPDAEVTLFRDGSPIRVVHTGPTGAFSFDKLDPASFQISARRLGYAPVKTMVILDTGRNIQGFRIVMTPLATELQDVVVGEESEKRLHDFYARKSRGGLARFIDRSEIARRDPVFISEMLRRIPGATVRAGRGFGNVVRIRGCQPTLWIDGKRMRNVEIDDIADPDGVAGLEIYSSSASVPIEFTDPINNMCGVVLIWTRSQ